jgi:hypothetical protein
MTKIIFLIFFMTACAFNDVKAFEVSKADTLLIAERVFKNECNVEKNCLLEWGAGEDFLSLGLEHFIWYPANAPNIFKEGFRSYLQYARQAGERLPGWLDKTPFPPCPWASREEFLNSKGSPQYNDLMDFMTRTKLTQANYLIENTKHSLQEIVAVAPEDQRLRIAKYISQLSGNARGLYAIIDYLNFKGAGIGNSDEFKGERWGLLQVLQSMSDMPTSQGALEEFVRSAKIVLTHRVFYAPVERHEEKWLQGWLRRIDTYLVI